MKLYGCLQQFEPNVLPMINLQSVPPARPHALPGTGTGSDDDNDDHHDHDGLFHGGGKFDCSMGVENLISTCKL